MNRFPVLSAYDDSLYPLVTSMNSILRPLHASSTLVVDVRYEDDSYVVEAQVPGVAKENLDLSFENNRLTIAVESDTQSERNDANYIVRESTHSSQSRSFTFDGIDAEHIRANLENGILTVTLPKLQKDSSQTRIEIE